MPGTSTHIGRIYVNEETSFGADQPLDTAIVKDVIANNLCHMADSHCAQVRVNWSPPKGGEGYIDRIGTVVADTPMPIRVFGPWSLPARGDGRSYRLRIRIGGYSTGGDDVHFYAKLARAGQPVGRIGARAVVESVDSTFQTDVTVGATAAWLSGGSKSSAWTAMIGMTAEELEDCRATIATLSPGSADPVLLDCYQVGLYVFGYTVSTGSSPALTNVYACDWIG